MTPSSGTFQVRQAGRYSSYLFGTNTSRCRRILAPGVDQTAPIADTAKAHNLSASSPAISITTKYPNDLVLDLPSIYGGSTLVSPTCTQQWDANVPNAITGASSSTTVQLPSTVSCGWTASSADFWDDVAVELKAAG